MRSAPKQWAFALDILCILAFARVLVAGAFCNSPSQAASLGLGFLLVGYFGGAEGLFVGLCVLPFISGLEVAGVIGIPDAPALSFASLLIGRFACTGRLWPREWHPCPGILSSLALFTSLVGLRWSVQIWQQFRSGTPFSELLQLQYGYEHPLYFLSTGTVWFLGTTLAALLLAHASLLKEWKARIHASVLITCLVFFGLQAWLRFPVAWSPVLRFFSPFPDIHAFGAGVVLAFGYYFGLITLGGPSSNRGTRAGLLIASGLLFVSYSRAAWLSAGCVVWICAALRWGLKRTAIVSVGLAALSFAVAHVAADHVTPGGYSERLVSLLRWESLAAKSPERVSLYGRAIRMVEAHPFVGVGLGRFYAESVRYVGPEDALPGIPNFAHNALLQLAAELGLLAAACLAATLYLMVRRADWGRQRQPGRLPELAAFTALFITQMTSNSINIYTSLQLLFWMSAVTLFATSVGPVGSQDSA